LEWLAELVSLPLNMLGIDETREQRGNS
jgi:hypothetical protein